MKENAKTNKSQFNFACYMMLHVYFMMIVQKGDDELTAFAAIAYMLPLT